MGGLVLASSSPRRRELLLRCGVCFRVVEPRVSEEILPEVMESGPLSVVVDLAARKAGDVWERLGGAESQEWVVGADTVVEADGLIMGKPAGEDEAREMILRLQGSDHRVHTGLAIFSPGVALPHTCSSTTIVSVRALCAAEIDWYVAAGEWEGAAGGYRIQERGGMLVKSITGSYSNVVGLPLEAFYGMLTAHGYRLGGAEQAL